MMIVLKNMDVEERIHQLEIEWYYAFNGKPDSILMHPDLFHQFTIALQKKYGHTFPDDKGNFSYRGLTLMSTTSHLKEDEIRLAKTKP